VTRGSRGRSDLVIGMTLAEVFLLLLIVGWYGSRLESEEAGLEPRSPAAILQKEVDDARLQLRQAEAERERMERRIHELQDVLTWLGQYLGASKAIRDNDSAAAAVSGYAINLKRGKAVCQPGDNILVDAVADSDSLVLTLRHPIVVQGGEMQAGQRFASEEEIDGLLGTVQQYYRERRSSNRDCAFDFTLAWRTDRDYRIAKKRLDLYFYPAGDRRLP
jgi:hypothetical protein